MTLTSVCVGVAAWSTLLAGISLTVSQVTLLHDAYAGSGPSLGTTPTAGVCVVVGGGLYFIAGLANVAVLRMYEVRDFIWVHVFFALGGALLAISGFGRPALIYSVEDFIESFTSPSTFLNGAGHLGVLLLMGVSTLELSFAKNSTTRGFFTPFGGVYLFFIGIWLMGAFGFWLPTLANSNSYDDLVKLYGKAGALPDGVHTAAPSVAWTWKYAFSSVGALLQAASALVFGFIDRGFLFKEQESELQRALLKEVDGYRSMGSVDSERLATAKFSPTTKFTAAAKKVGEVGEWHAQVRRTTMQKGPKGDLYHEHQVVLHEAGVDRVKKIAEGMGPHDVLLVVDMQNDFIPKDAAPQGGRFGVSEGELAAVVIIELIQLAAERGTHIIATRDYHPYNHCSFQPEGGPFPPHCIQGSVGSFIYPPVMEALDSARKAGARVDIVFKAFSPDVDSFGGTCSYGPEYFQERNLGFVRGAQIMSRGGLKRNALGCSAIDYTGGHCLCMSNFSNDMNAPPDVLAVLEKRTMLEIIDEPKAKRLLTTGLAMDFCVLDSSLNAEGQFAEVQMVVDAARAAHIPGVGPHGTGFLTDPTWIVEKMEKTGMSVVYSEDLKKPPGDWPSDAV